MRNVIKTTGHKNDFVYLEVADRDRVLVGKRSREIDDKKVSELAESIEVLGVMEPILVTHNKPACQYTVVAGAHRWRAICQVWDKHGENAGDFNIAAKIIHVAAGDEEIVELAENLIRNDLKPEQRKEMAMRYLALVGQAQNDNRPKKDNRPNGPDWFRTWYEATNIPKVSAQRLWQQFADAVGLTITPSKATVEQQQQFAQWHLEQIEKTKQAAAAAAKQSEDERKAAELKNATDAYERAKGVYQHACDIAQAAGVENIQFIT